jgi:sugar lactone lactonase YvrE
MGTKYNVDNSGNVTAVNSVKITTGTPPAAAKGTIYYDTTADQVKVSTDGSTFASMSQYKGALATDPTVYSQGDMWFNTATQTTKLASPSANSYYYGALADELSAPITGLTFTNATAFTICFWVG